MYRHIKHQLRYLNFKIPTLDNGTQCPACYEVHQIAKYNFECDILILLQGSMIFSIDANFGLCRKKKAGKSCHPPLHENIMFLDQLEVDSFVQQYQTKRNRRAKQVLKPLKHYS